MLQCAEKLENSVQEFIDAICGIYEYPKIKTILDTDFEYYEREGEIHYAIVVTNSFSKSFMTRVNRLYPDVNAPEFLWSLLHEVGHAMTGDELTEEEYDESWYNKRKIGLTAEEYYELPDEWYATDWAARCMRENSKIISIYWTNIQNILMDFYERNEVEMI